MNFPRTSGVLLHPTSLPGPYGIGDLGEAAYRWVDFLAETGQTLWQLMPLGPTGYGDSPYQSFSAFAGDPYLISPDLLAAKNLLAPADLHKVPAFSAHQVDYGPVIEWKTALLRTSFERFKAAAGEAEQTAFQAFAEAESGWLNDFALFMALKAAHGGAPWNAWDADIRSRRPEAMARWSERLADSMLEHKYVQYLFFTQWRAVKAYAQERSIKIIGDVPIFVAYDSDDVWANPDLFHLDEEGYPTQGAGVPPDYFSATGQLWGNPLYRWDVMAERGYDWWIGRFRAALTNVDIIRIDHFRGFEAYWAVPAGEPTAVNGQWVKGPGRDLFIAVKEALGDLPVIAEDLGLITADVMALRDGMGFPGMKILQFAFNGDPHQEYLPHNYAPNCVVYTGTHDNDTTVGWYAAATGLERDFIRHYLGRDSGEIHWDMIRLAFGSTANMAVVPLQDVLGLGSQARMNVPGQAGGNWGWRYTEDALTEDVKNRFKEVTFAYGRGTPPTAAKAEHRKRHYAGHHAAHRAAHPAHGGKHHPSAAAPATSA